MLTTRNPQPATRRTPTPRLALRIRSARPQSVNSCWQRLPDCQQRKAPGALLLAIIASKLPASDSQLPASRPYCQQSASKTIEIKKVAPPSPGPVPALRHRSLAEAVRASASRFESGAEREVAKQGTTRQ